VHVFTGLLEVLQLLGAEAEHSIALDICWPELASEHLGVDASFVEQLELDIGAQGMAPKLLVNLRAVGDGLTVLVVGGAEDELLLGEVGQDHPGLVVVQGHLLSRRVAKSPVAIVLLSLRAADVGAAPKIGQQVHVRAVELLVRLQLLQA
jgi:hypothetical protein